MIIDSADIYLAFPEIILLIGVSLALLADICFSRENSSPAYYVSILTLVVAGALSMMHVGGFPHILFAGNYVSDDMSFIMKLFISITVIFTIVYSKDYLLRLNMPLAEFCVLTLLSTLGMFVLVSGASMLTLYLGLELLSLPLYALTALARRDPESSEAAAKYFVMGAVASGMLLYGMTFIYGATGKIALLDVANAIASGWPAHAAMLTFGLIFILSGIGFKLASVPFHMWAPDVYEGAPTPVTMLISAGPKIAALALAMRMLTMGLIDLSASWQQMLMVMAILSIALGNLVAIAQTNLKRLFAYSAISHAGFILLGLASLTKQGFASSLFYVVIYALMSAAALGLLVILSKDSEEVQSLSDLTGLNSRNPWLAFLMMVTLFSMAGVPPTAGFFIKLMILKSLIDAGFMTLAVISLIFTVIGAFYYIKIIKIMYFDEPLIKGSIYVAPTALTFYSINGLMLLWFGLFPAGLLNWCMTALVS